MVTDGTASVAPERTAPRTRTATQEASKVSNQPLCKSTKSGLTIKAPESGESAAAHSAIYGAAHERELEVRERKYRFAEPFDMFFYYLERYQLHTQGRRQETPEERAAYRARASAVYHGLAQDEAERWRKIHKKLWKGDDHGVDEAKTRRLLEKQDILAKLVVDHDAELRCLKIAHANKPHPVVEMPGNHANHGPSVAAAYHIKNENGSRALKECIHVPQQASALHDVGKPRNFTLGTQSGGLQPVMIPFVKTKGVTTSLQVVFIVHAPDIFLPRLNEPELDAACPSTFGAGSAYFGVREWGANAWIASFETSQSANKAKGKIVSIRGVDLKAEHLYPRSGSPKVFIGDFSNNQNFSTEVVAI